MQIVKYSVNDLIMAEYNPRQLTEDQHQALKDSITRFGLVDPLIVNTHKDRKNILVGGHQRLRVAKLLGHKEVPCVEVDLDLNKEKELNVRLNKNTGQWDWDSLANYFDAGELLEWGFTEDELQFSEPEEIQGLTDDDDVPEVEESITKQGDLWILGEHRLLCGDATKKEDVERLMDGQKADMVFTDPPYGVDMNIKNDNLKGIEFDNFNNKWIKNIPYKKNIPFICYHSTRTFPSVLNKSLENGWNFERMLWYARPDKFPIHTWKSWVMVSQCILLFTKGNVVFKKVKPADQDFYKYTSKDLEKKKDKHPTTKIIKNLISILNHFDGDVFEPFLGSGSTLIACEKTNRKCYGLELDPHYCDVIVKRWEDYTGNKAERFEAGNA